jgi:hypothetical protein
MNGLLWWRRLSGGVGALVFASLLAGTAGGCNLLKPKPKKPLGGDCTDDLGCDSLTCSTVGNICSHSCTYDKDCADVTKDAVCRRKDDGSGQWCSKPVGAPPNGSCMNGNDCQHNECLKRVGQETQPGICSKYCASPDDCPAGMKICVSISDSGLLKVCIPGDPSTAGSGAASAFAPAPRTPGGAGQSAASPKKPAATPPPPAAPAPAPPPPAKKKH